MDGVFLAATLLQEVLDEFELVPLASRIFLALGALPLGKTLGLRLLLLG